jgi:hypothetical protein
MSTRSTAEHSEEHQLFGVVVHQSGPDGVWNSRWHRKGRTEEHTSARAVSWAIAVLFTVGSVLFVVGAIGAFRDAGWVRWANLIGSTLFSIGAMLAVVEVRAALVALHETPTTAHLWRNPGGRAALIQLPAAAFFFQIAMIAGAASGLDWLQTDAFLWTPSSIGSVGFVISSWIAVRECTPARDIGTWSTVANFAGSVGFLVGSLTGYFSQGPFNLNANDVSNPIFLVGSTLFLIGSTLGLAELRTPTELSRSNRSCSIVRARS